MKFLALKVCFTRYYYYYYLSLFLFFPLLFSIYPSIYCV